MSYYEAYDDAETLFGVSRGRPSCSTKAPAEQTADDDQGRDSDTQIRCLLRCDFARVREASAIFSDRRRAVLL